jgi:hypothetical protein
MSTPAPKLILRNSIMKKFIPSLVAVLLAACASAADSKSLYENNFEKAEVTKVPEDMLVLDGAFAVKEEGGNKFLELPGAPLETFGVLFGPTEASGLDVSARIQGTGKGRRFPTFGIGVNGVGGYRFQVSPAKKALELYKGDEVLATAPFTWVSESWTVLRLRYRKTKEGEFKIEGRAWKQGDAEPKEPQLTFVDKAEAPAGRPSIWGNPFAGTPIRYDDLKVSRASE